MTELTLKDALDLLFNRLDAIRFLWNLFMVVTLGVLGFMARERAGTPGRKLGILVAIGFLAFAGSNLYGLIMTQAEIIGFKDAAEKLGVTEYNTLKEALWAPSKTWIIAFHLTMDLVIITCILWLGGIKKGRGNTP